MQTKPWEMAQVKSIQGLQGLEFLGYTARHVWAWETHGGVCPNLSIQIEKPFLGWLIIGDRHFEEIKATLEM